jgi:hypothetical protein
MKKPAPETSQKQDEREGLMDTLVSRRKDPKCYVTGTSTYLKRYEKD